MSIQTASASVRKLAFIHTVSDLVSEFRALAKEHLPDWKPFAILDESLLRNTIERGSLCHLTKRRLATYAWSAVDAGADAIGRHMLNAWAGGRCHCAALSCAAVPY